MKIQFLGTGTSQGVPVIACECDVCKSANLKDKRLRTSIAIRYKNTQITIDAGPDFRQQMLRADIKKLDAVVFTHEHKDHIAGLDDVRAYNFLTKEPMQIYCTDQVYSALCREFHYVFDPEFSYPGIPKVETTLINKATTFRINDMILNPIEVMHYKLPVLGYRIKNFTYITDANFISEEEFKKMEGTEVLVINALRRKKHISHFTLDEALEIIQRIKPKKAYLTHVSHYLGLHDVVSLELPNGVALAYDGLEIEI